MALLKLWNSDPGAIGELSIEQILATAGDGNLKDETACSAEIRKYIAEISTTKLSNYVDHCLSSSFNKSGFVLQDLINELGRRLDYSVTNGRYQGVVNTVGFDGLWLSPEGHGIVVEVKTTDAYRINLETLATYRQKLLAAGKLPEQSSILIVVGRDDTGELEAQVRGSRQAWDIRLISTDALQKLVQLKESSGDLETGRKIRTLLTPLEYTRLDELVDAMFTTATDIESASDLTVADEENHEGEADKPADETKGYKFQFTDGLIISDKRARMIEAIGKRTKAKLIQKSRALFWDAAHDIRAVATISKRHERSPSYRY